jgi:type I restriction enzyme R subunit
MGSAMVRRLCETGAPPVIWNRDSSKATSLSLLGCKIAATPQELAATCDLIFACVHDAASVESVLFGANGVSLAGDRSRIFIDMSTIGPVATKVLAPRLRAALEKLNPKLPADAIASAADALTRDRGAMTLAGANREMWGLLKDGVKVAVREPERGGTRDEMREERVRVVDWENPAANDFLLVSQMTVTGQLYTCRPDLVGFVNGLPWVVIELKKPGVAARQAFEENLTSYMHPQNGVPQLFWSNAFLIASNGTDSRAGTITADWERFFEWKRIEREDEPRRVSLEVMLRGTCAPARLLDIAENFTLFSEHKSGLVKAMAQNHQYLGVNNAIAATLEARKAGHGRGGVFWQTQGSGKSFSMVFFAQKVLRKVAGNWTFVVVTDRVELDDQIAKTFKATGAVSEAEGDQCHAASGAHLRELLRGNHRYVFTLIHKFQPEKVRAETPSSPALLPGGEGSNCLDSMQILLLA